MPPSVPGCRVGDLLGEGATGVVYAAVNAQGDDVAIKFLRHSLSDDPEQVTRFRREADICRRLRSPFIAPVVGAGRTQDVHWIAYRRLRGDTLAQRLRRELVLALPTLGPMVEDVLSGLGVAHGAAVIHRDIKPANIMLEPTAAGERACILDFGLSKSSRGGTSTWQQSLTSATATLGTINYMPPEQVGGAAGVDHRADLYSAGVVAYRALTGQLPYVGRSQAVVLNAKLNADARSLGAATALPWPESLERFFRQALARDPAQRFTDAEAMTSAWRRARLDGRVPDLAVLRGRTSDSEDGDDTVLEPPSPTQ